MTSMQNIKNAFLHIFYPHVCAGCSSDALPVQSHICLSCLHQLPATGFEKYIQNPIEKIFWGRLPLQQASAHYYFNKHTPLQHIMHQLKYHGHKELGHQLGILMGNALLQSGRFKNINALVPMPLFAQREKQRGYNQAYILAQGIAEITNLPVYNDVILRNSVTETQTKKTRVERWENMQGKFVVPQPDKIAGKHLLLVDDVITTGATIEACGSVITNVQGCMLSVACLCYAKD